MVLGTLNIRGRYIMPKRLQFDRDEWLCITPEDYALILDRMRLDEILVEFVKLKEPELKSLFEGIALQAVPEAARVSEPETPGEARDASQIDARFVAEAESVLADPSAKYMSIDEFVKVIAVADLRKARKQKKISQSRLAKMSGLTQPQISNLEKDPSNVSLQTLRKVAKALGVRIFV